MTFDFNKFEAADDLEAMITESTKAKKVEIREAVRGRSEEKAKAEIKILQKMKKEGLESPDTAPLLKRLVTRLHKADKPWDHEPITIEQVLAEIRTGVLYKDAVLATREEYTTHGKSDRYTELKKTLPSVTFSGLFESGERVVNSNLNKHSGIVLADIDQLGDRLGEFRKAAENDPHTAFCFISPSGDGLKIGVPVEGVYLNNEDHRFAYFAVEAYYRDTFGVEIDPACKDVRRLCFVSFDPDVYVNDQAEPFRVPECTVGAALKRRSGAKAKKRKQSKLLVFNDRDGVESVMQGILEEACTAIREAREGEKHTTRRDKAHYIGGLAAGGLLDEKTALEALESAAADNTDNVEAALKTVQSSFEKGMEKPLSAGDVSALKPFIKNNWGVRNKSPKVLKFERKDQAELGDVDVEPSEQPKEVNNYEMQDNGLYKIEWSKRGGEWEKICTRICDPFKVVGLVRTEKQTGWGVLLRWLDPDKKEHTWVVPRSELTGDSITFAKELASRGLSPEPGKEACTVLSEYLQLYRTSTRVYCTDRTGWHGCDDNTGVYVLPDRSLGLKNAAKYMYQPDDMQVSGPYGISGELKEWQENVSKLCRGNSRLLFAVSTVFASTLLKLTNDEGGGIHFVGGSSIGKSTTGIVAGSVFGGAKMKQTWNATLNGLGALAVNFNDNTMLLDELSQCDPYAAGEVAYMLANGVEKGRAGRNGNAKERKNWRMLFLSNGEIDLEQHLLAVGQKAKAGQVIRLLTIPADAGAGHGVFEDLHGYPDGGRFADTLRVGAHRFYGTAGPAFVEAVALDFSEVQKWVLKQRQLFLDAHMPEGADAQVGRAARRFGLIGLAGELATEKGITGWQPGEALRAASDCFKAWIQYRGGVGNHEDRAVLDQIREHIERFGESRYQNVFEDYYTSPADRYGFRELADVGGDGSDSVYNYYIATGVFKSVVCAGLNPRMVVRVLCDAGILTRDVSDGKPQIRKRFKNVGVMRCYCIQGEKLFKDD